MNLFRSSKHPFVKWWWNTDRKTFLLVGLLMCVGLAVVSTASAAVSNTYDVGTYYFFKRQAVFIFLTLVTMVSLSLFSEKNVLRLGIIIFLVSLVGLVATQVLGSNVKGAQRWVYFAGISIQPSEFMKPGFIVLTAAILSVQNHALILQRFWVSFVFLALIWGLLLLQPDFGMSVLFGAVWFAQCFLAGVPLVLLLPLIFMGLFALGGGYLFLPHVASRIQRFVDPTAGDSYQVDQAREAFLSGGFFGRGAGEGSVKYYLPDAHTDFIFAVIGEEFGIIVCLILLFIYVALVYHVFKRVQDQESNFTLVAAGGLVTLFALQAIINMGVALQVLPTTGMPLPFISYGGSGTLAMGVVMGMVLALLRRKEGRVRNRRRRRI